MALMQAMVDNPKLIERPIIIKYLFIKNPNYQKPKEMTNARQKSAVATGSFKGF